MKSKILLVEDENSQRLLYKQVLADDGYDVFDAENSNDAIKILEKQHLDLAILDIRLAGGDDGLDLMGQIMQFDDDMPIILHTAYAAWKDNFRGRLADAYVVKSSDLSELKNTVRQILA